MTAETQPLKGLKRELSFSGVLHLNTIAQNYEWGHNADDSEVALLKEESGCEIDRSKPYAELWMGTHPSGPSTIEFERSPLLHRQQLLSFIRDYPDSLGDARSQFGTDLPFLFKILSVRTALSIQSHPDKALAKRLHQERPDVYKDGNHKPEMAIALSDFEALCGFCPHDELVNALHHYPELKECCGIAQSDAYCAEELPENRKKLLQSIFTALMTASPTKIKAKIKSLVDRLQSKSREKELTNKEQLILKLNEQYPGDVGVLAAFFFNFLKLQPGDAVALPANEPHAYVSGTIVECMATSDNVIRAGLTPKLRDTDVLCSSLSYHQGIPDILRGEEFGEDSYLKVYRPAFEEFEVWRFEPPTSGFSSLSLPAADGPMIMLVQKGRVAMQPEGGLLHSLTRGEVLFVSAGTAFSFVNAEDLVMWFAVPNKMWL